MKPLHPNLAAVVYQMRTMLATYKGTLTCAGCHKEKEASPRWAVGAYQPFTQGKKAGAYLVCPTCAATKKSMERAARYAETALRDMDESGVSK
jgi:hypothetical protein